MTAIASARPFRDRRAGGARGGAARLIRAVRRPEPGTQVPLGVNRRRTWRRRASFRVRTRQLTRSAADGRRRPGRVACRPPRLSRSRLAVLLATLAALAGAGSVGLGPAPAAA